MPNQFFALSKSKRTAFAAIGFACGLLAVSPVRAAEYGLGNYLLGYGLPMAGYTPPPGVYFSDTWYLYQGSASRNTRIPIGRNIVAGVSYNFLFNIAQTAWITEAKIFGGTLGVAAVVPFGGERTGASLAFIGPLGVPRQINANDSIAALGDAAFAAFLGWEQGEHHWNLTLTGFTPTGYYAKDALSFTGLNRPGLDIKGGYTFLSPQTGTEVSAALGVTVNAINNQTNYQSGAELHFEGALNQHFPFGLAVGVGGYYYQQITSDSGSGDLLGAFRGRVAAVGPMASYTFSYEKQQFTVSGRWFHEFDVTHRVRGDSIFASLAFRL